MRRRTAVWSVFVVLLAAAVAPTLLVAIPALADYPNHLARMFILATAGRPDANPYYEVVWALYPNLAMDLVVPQLARWFSVEAATKVFFLASQLLVVTGAVAIECVVKGRHQLSGFVALLVLHGLPFALGFVNFEFGTGLALWAVASWLSLRQRGWPLRLAAHAVWVALLFVGHFFALGIYGLALGAMRLGFQAPGVASFDAQCRPAHCWPHQSCHSSLLWPPPEASSADSRPNGIFSPRSIGFCWR